MSHTFVIAEIGSCHDGSLAKAKRLIDTAKEAGCDAVKAQYWSSADRLADRRHADDYREIYRKYQVPAEWLPWLADYARHLGLEFLCTVYLPEDIAVVAPLVRSFKVASFEATDTDFVLAHQEYEKPIIVSAGMLDAKQVRVLWARTLDGLAIDVLHCVSAYPCPVDQINLQCIAAEGFDGLSDHTTSPLTGAVAVGCGAEIIEFHLRLTDTEESNPDYATARTPGWARVYVTNIRQADMMLGDGTKRVMPAEEPMRRYQVRP